MLGLGNRLPQIARGPREARFTPPPALDWPEGQWPLDVQRRGGRYSVGIDPRSLVHPGNWTGAAMHVDGVAGAGANIGLGAADGDFTASK